MGLNAYNSYTKLIRNTVSTPLGNMTALAVDGVLAGLWFEAQVYYPNIEQWPVGDTPIFDILRKWLADYFAGKNPVWEEPLLFAGTAFQKAVWTELKSIPYGHTCNYEQIGLSVAEKQGLKTMSARSVGGAVGRNPISIVVPCHRVIGKSGKLTGYAGGLDKKEALLRLERFI